MITKALLLVAALAWAPAWGQPAPVLVGAVLSQSGPHAGLAAEYRRGIELWMEEVNAAGGLLGRRAELRALDDASEAIRTGALYVRLIRDEKADLLIGPYGTAASLMAGAEAESARRVLISGAGFSRAVHKRSPRYVFQSAVPYNAYGWGPLELAKQAGLARVLLIARDDPVAQEMAQGAREAALKLGLALGETQVYRGGASDFTVQVAKAVAERAQAWIAFGEVRDAGEMVKTFRKHGYAPQLFFVRGASSPALMEELGQDAELALGAREHDARLRTEGNERFVAAFSAKHGQRPSAAAAEGYAAGTVLAAGVRKAGTLDQAKLRAAIAALEIETVLGSFKVDPLTGEQAAARPVVTQIQRGRVELVWPESMRTAPPVLPYPQWEQRGVLGKQRKE